MPKTRDDVDSSSSNTRGRVFDIADLVTTVRLVVTCKIYGLDRAIFIWLRARAGDQKIEKNTYSSRSDLAKNASYVHVHAYAHRAS